jgi:hypothetical protein
MRPSKVMAKALSGGFVRREALWFEWRWKSFVVGFGDVAGAVEAGRLATTVGPNSGLARIDPGVVVETLPGTA